MDCVNIIINYYVIPYFSWKRLVIYNIAMNYKNKCYTIEGQFLIPRDFWHEITLQIYSHQFANHKFNWIVYSIILGLIFSTVSGVLSTGIYLRIYTFVLNKFKNCFTLGEGGLISQSFILLLYCTAANILNSLHTSYSSHMQISTIIIQVI